jgi:hypothetical protein
MLRGLLKGLIWGGLVSGFCLALLSLSQPLTVAPPAPAPAPAPMAALAPSLPGDAMQPPERPGPIPLDGASAPQQTTAPILPGAQAAPARTAAPAGLGMATAPADAPPAPAPHTAPRPVPDPAEVIEPRLTPPDAAPDAVRAPILPPSPRNDRVDSVARLAAPNRVMAQDPDARPDRVDTAPPPPHMPAPMLELDLVGPSDVAAVPAPVPGDAPAQSPIMAVVLIEDPMRPLDPATLAQIDFPVSLALDPAHPDAPARAAALRAAGFEVVITGAAAMGDGPARDDLAAGLMQAFDLVPEAVALIDASPIGRIDVDLRWRAALRAVLGDGRHGLIRFAPGPDAPVGAGRPLVGGEAVVFRLLDDADQRAPLIGRYLDRAAYAAGQQGAVIVVGRTRPETMTALFAWAREHADAPVRLAPVSAVLARIGR